MFKFPIKPKDDLTSKQIALAMIGELLQKYQAVDPKVAILPWATADATSLSPLIDPRGIILMESSTFHTKYTDCFCPKPKQNNWFCMALAHTCPHQHLLSGLDSNMDSWFTDNDCGGWLCAVQGSNSVVLISFFLYSGPFINVDRISEQLQAVSNQASQK